MKIGLSTRKLLLTVLLALMIGLTCLAQQILPGEGVSFYQLDLTYPGATQLYSRYGLAVVDYSAFPSAGYLNVSTASGPDGWVVRNLPIDPSSGYPGMSVMFDLKNVPSQPVTELMAYAEFSITPRDTFPGMPRRRFPVGRQIHNAQGSDLDRPTPPGVGVDATVITFTPGLATRLTWQTGHPSIEQDKDQCEAAAVANSLQWLKLAYGLPVPDPHQPGIRNNTLVGKLDVSMGRAAHGTTNLRPGHRGKLAYIDASGLWLFLSVRHKNRPGEAFLPNTNVSVNRVTSVVNNVATLSLADWVISEVERGSDVELRIGWDGGGGHVINLIGGGYILGVPWVSWVHDANQDYVRGDPDPLMTAINGGVNWNDGGVGFSFIVDNKLTCYIGGRTMPATISYAIAESFTDLGAPDLRALPGDGYCSLSWPDVPGATSYNIYRSTVSGEETLYTTTSDPNYVDTAVVRGTTYYYQVDATDGSQISPVSNEAYATPIGSGSPVAPDATGTGPLATTSAEYQFPAAVDSAVLSVRPTEIWARLYRPTTLAAGTRYPLIIFLHGNHGTCGTGSNPRIDSNCQYTTTGTCPAGYVVTPNHNGYGYLADKLASWGYLVVSINANRGITCGSGVAGDSGLNLARGRLVLRHLQRLSQWNNNPGTTPASLGVDLAGKIDFSNVGLMGHSRGGEGVRAAYNLYPSAAIPITDPVNFRAIFEIGPVDGQTSLTLNAMETVWNVLLPACDGDVSNLQGVKPFDRMMAIRTENNPTQKSTYFVYGANHNYYNTEWQTSDASGCTGSGNPQLWSGSIGSAAQRATGLASVLALFRGNLVSPIAGAYDPNFNQNFNPQNSLTVPPSKVKRGFTNSPDANVFGVTSDCNTLLEDFNQPTGTSSCGVPNCSTPSFNIVHGVGVVPNHAPSQPAARISWTAAGAFMTNSQPPAGGLDISGYATLDFRVSRQSSPLNPVTPTNFLISLVQDDGSGCGSFSGTVPLTNYLDPLEGPVGGVAGGLHPILQTIRIPLTDFPAGDLTNVRGVRFDFSGTGAIYMANIRLSAVPGPGALPLPESEPDLVRADSPAPTPEDPLILDSMNVLNRVQTVASSAVLENRPGVEIEVISDREFPVRGEMPILRIGQQEFNLSRYPDNGDTHTLIFTLSPEEFAQTAHDDPVVLQYGRGPSNDRWNFGPLDKSLLDK